MLYYRLYFMDRFSGHIDHFREFEAESDSTALELAQRQPDGVVEPAPQAQTLGRDCRLLTDREQADCLTAANARFTDSAAHRF